MSDQENQIAIEDLQLALEVYQIQSEQKLAQLQTLFSEKGSLDLSKMFYEQRSTTKIKFQNIISDLIQFLVKQEVATTEKLRKTFYRILENPLLLLFKISRFEIFDLRLNGFDIELEPIQAICELGKTLNSNIDDYVQLSKKKFQKYNGKQYACWDSYMEQAIINMIQDKIFVFYSYLRKGSSLLKKKFQNKIKIVQIFNQVEQKLLPLVLLNEDKKTLKEMSVLNFEIHQLEQSFDVLNFYLKVPFREIFVQSFQQFGMIGQRAKKASNYNLYILEFAKYGKQIMHKIQNEGIDTCFDPYIENALKGILQMWGCRICYYQQFCELFRILMNSHSNKIKILEICLQHTPKMQKEDVVLLRTNFKLQMNKKHNELLSLMKARNLEQMNEFLSTFYHRQFYNFDFKPIQREQIIKVLTMMNGNSSLNQFFQITERAIKQWNHTIDFSHPHKYIESEYSQPKISQNKQIETFKLITNLCLLQQKGFNKQYEDLVRGNTIGKALLGLINYVSATENLKNLREFKQYEDLVISSFNFLKKCLNPVTQAQNLALKFAPLTLNIKNEEQRQLQVGLIKYVGQNIGNFHIEGCLQVFNKLKKCDYSQIVNIFLGGLYESNKFIQNFKYLDQNAAQVQNKNITKSQAKFISDHYVLKNQIVCAKDNGIFKLSQFQVMTNPIHFQKVMDNLYFTLDSNSKKFIQYLITLWFNASQQTQIQENIFKFYTQLIKQVLNDYPLSIPLLASKRVEIKNGEQAQNRRFCQYLANILGKHKQTQLEIIKMIVDCKCIRYRNGKDYIQEQVLPMILKVLIKNINSYKHQVNNEIPININNSIVLGAKIIQRYNLKNIKSDVIQKLIQKIRYFLTVVNESNTAVKLAQAHQDLLKVFFKKKQLDLKKTDLSNTFDKISWNQIRNYNTSNQSNKGVPDESIPQQIIITPYTISQQYNIDDYKIKDIPKINKQKSQQSYKLNEILKKLKQLDEEQKPSYATSIKSVPVPAKKINLVNSKHNLINNLGFDHLQSIADKQNLCFVMQERNNKILEIQPSSNKADENINFVHYYLKQFQVPSVNHKTILANLIELLKFDNPMISYLWTNSKNLQYYFMDLYSIFQYAALQPENQKPQKQPLIDQIVQMVNQNPIKILQQILKLFKNLGYSNIWAESMNMFWLNFPIRKHLGLNKPSEQSVFSVVLNIALNKPELKDDLNDFLGEFFKTRQNQTALMYKVVMDKSLMNLIMKSLQIQHLDKISILFHSNFNNLRLYTDQLHQGLKALNMASTNRSYNQYIKLSKTIQDEEFQGKMKLFRQNFSFFIRIEKQGYNFKRNQQKKLVIDRLTTILRSCEQKENATQKVDAVMKQYIKQIQQLQITIANRVKSFYLVTKLRDLSYQNSLMISILQSVMKSEGAESKDILNQIKKVQIFSLLNILYNQLIIFEDDWRDLQKYSTLVKMDDNKLQNQLTICTNRRFSHSMSKIYEKCDLQFDEVMQRCFDALKVFFKTQEGNIFMNMLEIYPAFLIKSFIDQDKAKSFSKQIYKKLTANKKQYSFQIQQKKLIEDLIQGFRDAPQQSFAQKSLQIKLGAKKYTPVTILPLVIARLQQNQTLITLKSTNYLLFNKYKTSQATLQQIEVLGYIISYSLLNSCPLSFNIHPSIIAALSFNISDLDYLLDIDFKIWQQLKNVLSTADSSKLQLNFSYNFESLQDFKPVRIQLVDKGSSKKVNNLNREQYCDLICSYLLFENLRPQIHRLLKTVLSIVPKEYICCQSTKSILELFYNKQSTQKLLNIYMKKIGVVLPETLIDEKNKRYENLKDFQNIQWLQELILQSAQLRQKYWKDENNIFIITYIGSKGSIKLINGAFLVEHFSSKQQMKKQLLKL